MLTLILLILCVLFIIFATTKLNLHPFLALLISAIAFGIFSDMTLPELVASINEGFGGTIGEIGIVIIAGTIIGTFLDESGGAFALADRVLRFIGEKSVHLAIAIVGYIVSIPVFADSGFVILTPLNKALSKKANLSLAGTAIALGLGLACSHALVPPTPGPIAAAGILEVNLGTVIMFGVPVSLVALTAAFLYGKYYASRFFIDPNPELSQEEMENRIKDAPNAFKSVVPVLVPLVLIVLKSVSDLPSHPFGEGNLGKFIGFIGDPIIALLIGVFLAFLLPKKLKKEMLSTNGWVGKGLLNAAIIIMITGAGGAFGKVLENSGIANTLGDMLSGVNIGIWLPFIIASAIKISQGSTTVALITTASIMAPLAPTLGFETDIAKALVVLAIGAGGLVVSHANDSFFWIFTQMTNMTVKTGYKLHSLGTLVIGTVSALTIWILSLIFI